MSSFAICSPTNDLTVWDNKHRTKMIRVQQTMFWRVLLWQRMVKSKTCVHIPWTGTWHPLLIFHLSSSFHVLPILGVLYALSTTLTWKDMAWELLFRDFAWVITLGFRGYRHHNSGGRIQKQTLFISKFYQNLALYPIKVKNTSLPLSCITQPPECSVAC